MTEHDVIIDVCSRRGVDPEIKTWNDVRLLLNDMLGKNNLTPRTYQHIYKEYLDKTIAPELIRETRKEKYQLQDVVREYNSSIRDEARIDNLIEAVENGLRDFEPITFKPVNYSKSGRYAIAVVSDWHIGSQHKNYVSEYNLDIASKRVMKYAKRIVDEVNDKDIEELLIINLNDLIEGNIHISTRVQAEMDAVQQTIHASMLLTEFIRYIADNTNARLKVGSVLENHSRINKNKKEHIEAESFGKLIDFIVQDRIKDDRVMFVGNPLDDNIGLTQFGGLNVAYVHGHLDHPKSVKDKLDNLIGVQMDLVVMAHRHHILIDENVVQVGSLKGTDSYAFDHRLVSKASQTMIFFSDDELIHHHVLFE